MKQSKERKNDVVTKQLTDHERQLRKEATRLAALANKRLKRLEGEGFEKSSAYKKWFDAGAQKFGIKGKDYNAVQIEIARIREFVQSKTSTVTGARKVLNELASAIGMQPDPKASPEEKKRNIQLIQDNANKFFELANRVNEYLFNVMDALTLTLSNQVHEEIRKYVEVEGFELVDSEGDIEQAVEYISNVIIDQTIQDTVNLYNDDFPDEGQYTVYSFD